MGRGRGRASPRGLFVLSVAQLPEIAEHAIRQFLCFVQLEEVCFLVCREESMQDLLKSFHELICMVSKVCDIRAVPAFVNLQHLVEFLGSYCGRIHQERSDGMILIRRSHRFSERIDKGLEIVIVVVYATSQDVFPFDTR